MSNEVKCESYHLFDEEQRKYIKRIVLSAVQMHATRLKVRPIKNGFKVPTLNGDFCSRFTIPDEHKVNGVLNADMVLYVAPLTPEGRIRTAIAAPCAALNDGRPVVGGIAYNILSANVNSYSVRITAHHIAHALGFSYNIMKDSKGVKLTKREGIRQKPHVMEVTGSNTVNAVKKHFNCSTATGMELEDETGFMNTVSYSHWERRNARDDLMSTVIGKARYSALTLALFTDLGYYQAEMDKAEPMDWGLNAGCDFLTQLCITNGKTAFPKYFCEDVENDNFNCDDTWVALTCPHMVNDDDSSVPSYFNYFKDNKINSESLFVDNCPIWVKKNNVRCTDDSKKVLPGYIVRSSLCFKKASESTDISGSDKYKGMCVNVETTQNDEIHITYESNKKVTCSDGKAALGGSYNGVILECPTVEDLYQKRNEDDEDSIIINRNEVDYEQKEYIMQVKLENENEPENDISKTPAQEIIEPVQTQSGEKEEKSIIPEKDEKEQTEEKKNAERKTEQSQEISTSQHNAIPPVKDVILSDHTTKGPKKDTKPTENEKMTPPNINNSSGERNITPIEGDKSPNNKTTTNDNKKNSTEETNLTRTAKIEENHTPETKLKPKTATETTSESTEGVLEKLPYAEKNNNINDKSYSKYTLLSFPIIFLIFLNTILQ